MKRIILILVFTILAAQSAPAREGSFGLGVILGEPTGISMKLWLSNSTALDGAVAWSLDRDYSFHIHADYLLHRFTLIKVEKGRLPLYYGIGGRIKIRDGDRPGNNDDENIGVRFPVGLDYLFDGAPFDIYFELVPILELVPDTDFDIDAALGFRYWF